MSQRPRPTHHPSRALTGPTGALCAALTLGSRAGRVTVAIPAEVTGEGSPRGAYQVLVVEEVHHSGCPVTRGDQVGRRPVQTQQAQGGALLRAVHGVSERQPSSHGQHSQHGLELREHPPSRTEPEARQWASWKDTQSRASASGGVCSKGLPRDFTPAHCGKEPLPRLSLGPSCCRWPWLCGWSGHHPLIVCT